MVFQYNIIHIAHLWPSACPVVTLSPLLSKARLALGINVSVLGLVIMKTEWQYYCINEMHVLQVFCMVTIYLLVRVSADWEDFLGQLKHNSKDKI